MENGVACHTLFENLKKGFIHGEARKRGFKRIDKIGYKLIKEGLILPKPTGYGQEISLNPKKNRGM